MANVWANAVITNKGLSLQAKLISGTTLNITRAVTGSGYVNPTLLPQQTAVSEIKQTLTASEISYPATGKCEVLMRLTNDALATGYTANQVGVYATDPDEGEILYFICQAAQGHGTEIPSVTEMPGFSAEWSLYFQYGMADEVTITVDPSGVTSILHGGTGATTAADARANLDAQQRTNSLTTEDAIADADTVPFYDASATAHRKTAWSNIKAKMKTYFDGLYLTLINAAGIYSAATAAKTLSGNTTVTTTPIPTGGWTRVIASATTYYRSGLYEALTNESEEASSLALYKAFDGDVNTRYGSGSSVQTAFISIKLPSPLLATKVKIRFSTVESGGGGFIIGGSNDNSQWTNLYTSQLNTIGSLTEITLTNTGSYRYYRIYVPRSSAGWTYVYEFQISEYLVPIYSMAYTVAGVPTTWADGQILRMETPSTDTVGIDYCTVNGVQVDSVLKPSTKYELIFKTNKFYAREVA